MDIRTAREKCCKICDQSVYDPKAGFMLNVDVLPHGWGFRLRIETDHDLGHREFSFDENGIFKGCICPVPSKILRSSD